jgi:4a-hydroxytetrahydrobiopterin dehydratase
VELLTPALLIDETAGLGWELGDRELVKVVRCRDFVAALEYVNAVGQVAERSGHHPDIDIRWNSVTLRLTTHSLGGISDADIALAKRIDKIG